ncbi:MAG: hypothetical protein CML04_11735 [Pseudozobellia sp.]|nr:hypothetical protein [Pseudozobellia sp.]MBG50328.1 hypothetical protein [Pseudozobellia sp.]MBG50542.1 hypothetical protein [Pseudozobellia sp.]|tara:strand:+ start:2335 stop:2946 length:612 start_codon:yes stop_codon:yes gene_type:complete
MKFLKGFLLVLVALIVGYFSIEIRPLKELKNEGETFDHVTYAQNYVNTELPTVYTDAIPLPELVQRLQSDKQGAFDEWSNAIAVGNIGYFLIQFTASVKDNSDDEYLLAISDELIVRLQTEFIYGNAIRDASGLIDNKEFQNTSDLNAIAAEVNKMIRNTVIPPFKEKAEVGDTLQVIGAMEVNKKFPPTNKFKVLPVQIKFQ